MWIYTSLKNVFANTFTYAAKNNAMSSFWLREQGLDLTSARASAVLQQEKGNRMKYIWVPAMRLLHPQALGKGNATVIWVSARAVANGSSPYAVLRFNAGSWKMVLPDVSCGWTSTVISILAARANALIQAQRRAAVAVSDLDALALPAGHTSRAQLCSGAVCRGWRLLLPCKGLLPAISSLLCDGVTCLW